MEAAIARASAAGFMLREIAPGEFAAERWGRLRFFSSLPEVVRWLDQVCGKALTPARKPRNLAALLQYRHKHNGAHAHTVVVSLIGETSLRWPHVYAEPGLPHDWSDLDELHCVIATRPYVDARHTIAGLWRMASELNFMAPGYPTLADMDRQQAMHVCEIAPAMRFIQVKHGSREWQTYFG
jgi:hypothetical protein